MRVAALMLAGLLGANAANRGCAEGPPPPAEVAAPAEPAPLEERLLRSVSCGCVQCSATLCTLGGDCATGSAPIRELDDPCATSTAVVKAALAALPLSQGPQDEAVLHGQLLEAALACPSPLLHVSRAAKDRGPEAAERLMAQLAKGPPPEAVEEVTPLLRSPEVLYSMRALGEQTLIVEMGAARAEVRFPEPVLGALEPFPLFDPERLPWALAHYCAYLYQSPHGMNPAFYTHWNEGVWEGLMVDNLIQSSDTERMKSLDRHHTATASTAEHVSQTLEWARRDFHRALGEVGILCEVVVR